MAGLLDGKIAIVTGAGHGIGRGHAMELARHGARVVVNDRGTTSARGEGSGKDADFTVDLITKRGGTALPDYGDVSDEGDVQAMFDRVLDEWGRLDILVNNAGIVRDATIWNMDPADFDAVMRVHVRGTWLPSRLAAIHWRERAKSEGTPVGGRLINTTSGAGLLGNFGQSNYATAKAAIVALTLTLSLELHRIGVTVNAIGPGGATRISATLASGPKVIEADEVPDDQWHPMDPSGSSPVVAWLSSDEAQYVTGQVIRVVGDHIHLMEGWTEKVSLSSGQKRWDATKLGDVFATDIFKTRAPGLRM